MSSAADWDTLAPPLELPAAETPPEDKTPGDAPICPVCGEVIIRDPSWKRMRKYHPECASQASHKGSGTSGGSSRSGGSGYPRKAEQEADACKAILQSAFVKLALGVSVVDRYDAFCIMVNTEGVCSSFRGVCLRYPAFRKEILSVKTGGSVVGLAASLLFMFAPMFAHHGLIPSKTVAEAMVKLPMLLYQLSVRVKEGEEGLSSMMREYMDQMREESRRREAREAERARREGAERNGQYVGPTHN